MNKIENYDLAMSGPDTQRNDWLRFRCSVNGEAYRMAIIVNGDTTPREAADRLIELGKGIIDLEERDIEDIKERHRQSEEHDESSRD